MASLLMESIIVYTQHVQINIKGLQTQGQAACTQRPFLPNREITFKYSENVIVHFDRLYGEFAQSVLYSMLHRNKKGSFLFLLESPSLQEGR